MINSKNCATYKEKKFWSGCVNLLDGRIEEVHSYEEALFCDFHHSLYFSDSAIDGMENGKMAFFWVDDGIIHGTWREILSPILIAQLREQIVFATC